MNDRFISAEKFMELFRKATAVDYEGFYMTIQDDDDEFIFLHNGNREDNVSFPKSIIEGGVFVNKFNDMFRFNDENCEWFGMLSQMKVID